MSSFGVTPIFAELIFLKNGRVIRSNIKKVTPVFIRTTTRDKNGRTEYLVDEIYKIEPDKTQEYQISEMAIENIRLRQSNQINRKLRKAALEKAAEIIGQAVAEINMTDFDKVPNDVRSAAFEVANELIMEAMINTSELNVRQQAPAMTKIPEENLAQRAITRAAQNIGVVKKTIVSAPVPVEEPLVITPVTEEKIKESLEGFPKDEIKKKLIYSDARQTIYQLLPDEPEEQ